MLIVTLLFWSGTAFAQYTIVLKNGRRITVQTYREEGGMIKFFGMGGEIGIARDQVKTILKPGEKEERGMVVVPGVEGIRAAPAEAKPEEKKGVAPKALAEPKPEEKAPSPEPKEEQARAGELTEYQRRLQEITKKLTAARERHSVLSQQPTDQSGTSRTASESLKLKEAIGVGSWAYTETEKEIIELRKEIDRLERERDRLLQDMR